MTFGAPSVTSPSNYYCLRSRGGSESFRQRNIFNAEVTGDAKVKIGKKDEGD